MLGKFKHILLTLVIALAYINQAHAGLIVYTDRAEFESALSSPMAFEGFNDSEQLSSDISLISGARSYNHDWLQYIDIHTMVPTCEAIIRSALMRKESRGAHYRSDYPKRNDQAWLKHTLISKTKTGYAFEDKPVVITKYQPKERHY